MRFYFNRDTSRLTARPGYNQDVGGLVFKRGDSIPLELSFHKDSGESVEVTAPVIRFGLKATPDGTLLAVAEEWAFSDGVWKAVLNLNTAALDAELEGQSSVKLNGELTFTDASGGPTSSQTIAVTVENDILKGDEGTPFELPTPDSWLDVRALRYDKAQALDPAEKAQAGANLGLGAAAWLATSTGGAAAADAGKVLAYGANGTINATRWLFVVDASVAGASAELVAYLGAQMVRFTNNGFSLSLTGPVLTGNRNVSIPDESGAIILSLNMVAKVDRAGVTGILSDGRRHLAVWNQDENKYQGLVITGVGAAAAVAVYDLP